MFVQYISLNGKYAVVYDSAYKLYDVYEIVGGVSVTHWKSVSGSLGSYRAARIEAERLA